MILQIYAVHDRAVGAYMQPFFARSEGEAFRLLRQAVNSPDTSFFQNPADYTLVHLGEFSDQTGEFASIPPASMVNLSSLTVEITSRPTPPQFDAEARN